MFKLIFINSQRLFVFRFGFFGKMLLHTQVASQLGSLDAYALVLVRFFGYNIFLVYYLTVLSEISVDQASRRIVIVKHDIRIRHMGYADGEGLQSGDSRLF